MATDDSIPIWVDKAIHQRLKVASAQKGVTMRSYLRELLEGVEMDG